MIENKSNRIDYLDIAKALGVIMVVWGHASGPLSTYMFQCHLPLFFIISGYLYNKNGGGKALHN
ncbi:MAG: acyltransferase family protein [Hungatella sp.]|nr:acyltransferase family protein [Hungatella sp.]